jgi:hypothetical protein
MTLKLLNDDDIDKLVSGVSNKIKIKGLILKLKEKKVYFFLLNSNS